MLAFLSTLYFCSPCRCLQFVTHVLLALSCRKNVEIRIAFTFETHFSVLLSYFCLLSPRFFFFFFFTLVLDYFYSSSCSLSSFFIVSTYLHFRFSCCLFLIVIFVSILVHEIICCLSSFLIIISTCLHFQFFVPAYFYSLFPFLFLFLSIHPHYVVFHPCSCLFLSVIFVFILVSDYFCSLP